MGAAVQKPNVLKAEVVTKIINTSIIEFEPTTQVTNSALNYIQVGNNSNVTNIKQAISMVNTVESMHYLSQTVDFNTKLQTSIINQLKKQNIALLSDLGSLFTNKNVDLTTTVNNYIKNIAITRVLPLCISDNNLVNTLIVGNSSNVSGIEQTITGDFYLKCIDEAKVGINMVSDIVNDINQKADVSDNPLTPLADAVSSVFDNFIWIAIAAVCIVVLFLLVSSFLSKRKNKTAEEKGGNVKIITTSK